MEEFNEKKDDLKTTITPEEVIQQIKEKLPELKEIDVFGNKFKNVEVIFWLCLICLPLILLLSFRKNELWALLNVFWCLGTLYYQIHLHFLNYLIYSNFGNILFQLLYILFYIWDIGTVYQLEGNTGKTYRNFSLLMEFILICIELVILAFLLKNDSLKKEEAEIQVNDINIIEDKNIVPPISPLKKKKQVLKPTRIFPQANGDNKNYIRRIEDDDEP